MSLGIWTLFHDWPTWLIVVGLLGLMIAANEVGFRSLGRKYQKETDLFNSVSGSLKASVFALVGLLLGFSFSATAGRYDIRQRLALDQANAVGTCYLRAGLLDDPYRTRLRDTLRHYVDARLDLYAKGLDPVATDRTRDQVDRLLGQLWTEVEEANRRHPDAVRNSMLVPAANEVIDLSSTRAWAYRNHLPDPVLGLLLGCVLVASLLIGHSSGQAGKRHAGLWMATNLVFALVLYVVLDFDRPRRGLIKADQTPLIELKASIAKPAAS